MRESTVNLMLRLLSRHYGEPVKPVSKYCESLKTWAHLIEEKRAETPKDKHTFGENYAPYLHNILRDISKSNLLARLIYGGEKLRSRECPIHKGRWSGIGECPEGCEETGWLPEPSEKAPPKEVSVVDVIETNAVVDPKDMRRWLENHGWSSKPSTVGITLWEKLVRNEGATEKVLVGIPAEDDHPEFGRFVEDAIYTICDKFGDRPSHLLLAIYESK